MKSVLIFLLIFAGTLLLGFGWWKVSSRPASGNTATSGFLITKGSSVGVIGKNLKKEGLITSPLAFKFYLQLTGKAKKIQAGEYELSPSYSLVKIISQLLKGPTQVWVTIPEGLRREEIAEKIISALGKKAEAKDLFRQDFLKLTAGKEGYLFPDTYLFPKDVKVEVVIDKMLMTFGQRFGSKMKNDLSGSGRLLTEVVILASLLERETVTEEERPIVAGILYKRLAKDWPLQVDASLQYAVGSRNCQAGNTECEWWPNLTKEDLLIKSPYNLYKDIGLPPAPISNPGLSSLKAALYPKTSSFWFYLHDSRGQIHYAETLEEHNQNIKSYLGK